MKSIKRVLAILALVACVRSASAFPTITVNDSGGGLSTVPVSSASGFVVYSSSDAYWSLVIASGIASPPCAGYGTIIAPYLSLTIQATSTAVSGANQHPLTISFTSDDIYGPTAGEFVAQLTGHTVSGTGQPIIFSTFYNNTTNLTTSVSLPGPLYDDSWTSAHVNLSGYSLTEVIAIKATSAAGASYSLDGILTVTNVYAAPLPVLAINHSATNIVLTWPTNASGFTLQSTTNLAPTAWTINSPAPVVLNTNNVVTNSISGIRKFYRLSQ